MPLVLLVRFCPFPFSYSNAFFASIETVSLVQFLLATLAITPKRVFVLTPMSEKLRLANVKRSGWTF